eukprot:sb/3472597/
MLREVKNQATQTTILISINYFFLNCVFVVGNLYFRLSTPPTTDPSPVVLFAEFIVYRVALPLNSSINPLIYLTRSSPMREFVCNGFDVRRTRSRRLLHQVGQNGTMMLRQITRRIKNPVERGQEIYIDIHIYIFIYISSAEKNVYLTRAWDDLRTKRLGRLVR